MIIFCWTLLRMTNFQTSVVEKITIHVLNSITFSPDNCAVYEIMWKHVVQPDWPQVTIYIYIYIYIYIPPQKKCHHMSFVDFVVLPPGHGRSVTDFWGWDVHEAQLRCPGGVWVVIKEDAVPGGTLNLKTTNLPRPWSPRESSPSRKIPTVEPGIEPGTSWLVVRDSDH